ncbi:MAG: LysM peptidoglycan-binding domain-containing M23 family metallopeptidase [Cyanobacteria bacterium P01_A01_bin.105]
MFIGTLPPFLSRNRWALVGAIALLTVAGSPTPSLAQADTPADALCPAPALARLETHRVSTGETLASIAARYELLPATLTRLNPSVRVAPGQTLRIPPFNGIVVSGRGQTWQTLASQHRISADLIFEVNGCPTAVPRQVFIPGTRWYSATTGSAPIRLSGYPLTETAPQILSYGWHPHPEREELVFNSGIALAPHQGTEVLTVADGTIAFAGAQPGYGNLVVVNHANGLQTRYANLEEISVSVGERVRSGNSLGKVGDNQPEAEAFLYFEVRARSNQGLAEPR